MFSRLRKDEAVTAGETAYLLITLPSLSSEMNKILLVLALSLPVNSYAFDWFNDKGFYITFGGRPNPVVRSIKNKHGQEYGLLASFVWCVAGDEVGLPAGQINRLTFTWEF